MIREHSIQQLSSPLRYPGGKGLLGKYFVDLVRQNSLTDCKYFEPFAGGAGVGLRLLSAGVASDILLNDADYHIYCFWKTIITYNREFIDRLNSISLNMKEWNAQKEIYQNPRQNTIFDVAFATFFLNRCNRSGIIAGAGPIGGYNQNGEWGLDARFNKAALTERILRIGSLKNRIVIYNMDAIEFLKERLPKGKDRARVLVYCDPPYVSAGNKLYFNSYQKNDHQRLSRYLLAQNNLKWVVSYDDNPLIRELYASCQKWIFSLGYSLQTTHKGRELLIAPNDMALPGKKSVVTAKCNLIRKMYGAKNPMEVLV